MFRNYLKAAWRSVVKQKSNTAINIAGLSLGIAACLAIFLVVKNEMTYDAWHTKSDRTYRITLNELDFNPSVSTVVLPALMKDFPEIEKGTMVIYLGNVTLGVNEHPYAEKLMLAVDSNFTEVFDYEWLRGDKRTALKDPGTIVLTASMARKYFGDADPIGKAIVMDGHEGIKITGVVADPPANTHMPFRFLLSMASLSKEFRNDQFFSIRGARSYFVTPAGYDIARMQSRMKGFITEHWGADIAARTNLPLQPLRAIHFDQRYLFDHFSPTVSRTTYLALGGVAIFVLLTACINFINLATARALKRAREVGVRKTLGSSRWQLILQFLMETGIVTVIAVVLAIGLTAAFLPAATAWLDVRLADNVLFRSDVIGLLALLTVVVVLLAGIYPAFVQSNFQAATSLKGAVRTGGLSLRKSLVVTQFVISQVMIAGTLVVAHQMDFFRNGNLGFDKEAVISLPVPDAGKRDVFAAQLAAMPGIKDYSFAVAAPVYGGPATSFQNKFMSAHDVVDMKMVDERYFNMFQLKMLAGEPVRQTPRTDTTRPVVINATMARILGHKTPEAALGQQFELGGMSVMINGVVKDFQQGSRHKLIRSAVLFYNPDAFRSVSVKLSGRNMQQQIAGIEKAWTTLFPQAAFTYEFLDDHIASLYRQEQKTYTAFRIFSLLAIFIGCLGLYGLVTFSAAQRTKEIGVRKVLGASVTSILGLLGKEFIWLIVIAFCIAAPLAFWLMNRWLGSFAYRVNISSDVFIATLVVTFVIAGLTIAHQSLKAALMNPVKSLKAD